MDDMWRTLHVHRLYVWILLNSCFNHLAVLCWGTFCSMFKLKLRCMFLYVKISPLIVWVNNMNSVIPFICVWEIWPLWNTIIQQQFAPKLRNQRKMISLVLVGRFLNAVCIKFLLPFNNLSLSAQTFTLLKSKRFFKHKLIKVMRWHVST